MSHNGATNSFRKELLQAAHDFDTHIFKIALLEGNFGPDLELYDGSGEVSGSGYTPGGIQINVSDDYPRFDLAPNGISAASVRFDDVHWPTAEVSTNAALIYNSSNGNKSVMLLNFGRTYQSSSLNGFRVTFPATTHAVIRI